MLYDSESIAHYKTTNVIIWMMMAFQGGFLNVGGFMACHRFVSHVTGYGTSIGFELSSFHLQQVFDLAIVPVCFLLGSVLSGFLVDLRLRLHKKPRYYITFGLIFGLIGLVLILGLSGFYGVFGAPLSDGRGYELLITLSFVCALQNGTITTVSKAVIRTTHLSGILTDLGLGLVRFFHRDRLDASLEDGRANLMRIGIITSFIGGSLVGALAFSRLGFLGFAGPCLISGLLCSAMVYVKFSRRLSR